MKRTTDMTIGNPLSLIIRFAFPLLITNLGQQLYMIADASIVGRGVGIKALASVGSADWIYWLVLWTVMMLTQAFSTFVARNFGEKNFEMMNKTIANSAILCIISGIFLTAGGLLISKPLLVLLDTPTDIIDGSSLYLHTMISGTLIVTAYNMAASILRALGDGKTPLIAMIISALMNIGLDLIFVFVFKWGIFGAAIASVISQFFSFLYCLLKILRTDTIKIEKHHWIPDLILVKKLLAFAIPLALQYIIINFGGIVLQSTINAEGSIFVAGFTATNKLYGLLECSAISLGTAFTTYFSQNYGAGNFKRVKQGHKCAVLLSTIAACVIMLLVLFAGKHLLKLFLDITSQDGEMAFVIAWKYLKIMSFCLIILYLIYVYRSLMQSAGDSFWSFISGIAEFFVRAGMAKIIILILGTEVLFFAEPLAWLAALLFVMIPYFIKEKSLYGDNLNNQ